MTAHSPGLARTLQEKWRG